MIIRKYRLEKPIMTSRVMVPDGETISVVYESGAVYLQASLCFVLVHMDEKSAVVMERKDELVEIDSAHADELFVAMGLKIMSQSSLLRFLVSNSMIKKMKFKGLVVEKFVDMVGHIKSLPIGIFEVVGKDGDLLIVRALGSSEPLVELLMERE